MDDYLPPEDDELALIPVEAIKTPEPTGNFDFDPSRSSSELALLNVTAEHTDPQSGAIRYWSFSTLSVFKECRYRVRKRKIERIPEPSGPAADRGNEIHDQAEHYVDGSSDELPKAKKIEVFQSRFNALREEYQAGNVELEQDWWFDADWTPIEAKGKPHDCEALWYIAKLDVFLWESKTCARIIDHKTGKKYEMKHSQQAMQYAIAAFMRYPELEYIETEFWYLDQGSELRKSYTREQAMVMLPRVASNALELTTCHKDAFTPNPSAWNCRFCHYATSGDCEYAYEAL
ncbi:PD-(D/E)XK nuclease family protein [Endozoicomonas ascidiicola]|uniref:PD-(D/E)XK nuclease family protein n=1 Tax=Endozoicomonas ascidiicola TaxID=1698521 RepID=UPI00082C3827|nr:PD-(D/E)XK nuclease family protein [Endozoicomonas ascidiicola]